jgi:hypothetical protein
MRVVFGYRNLSRWDNCSECSKRIPFGPYSAFPGLGGLGPQLHTTCPSCGGVELMDELRAGWALSHGASIDDLRELAETPDEVRAGTHRVKFRRFREAADVEFRVGGDVVCPGCDKPLMLPADLQDHAAAVVRCHECNRDVHLLPPPRWLLGYCRAVSHLLTLEPPPSFPCPRCQAPIYVERAPAEVRCEACRKKVEVPDSARGGAVDPERPFHARLHLTSTGFERAHPPIGIYLGIALGVLAAAGITLAATSGMRPEVVAVISIPAAVVAMLGALSISLSVRNRRRRREYVERLAREEAAAVAPTPTDRPYR